jgi:hypothetical protein
LLPRGQERDRGQSCRWHPTHERVNPLETARYSERFSPFEYRSEESKQVYNKRVSVERVFSRLTGYRTLNAIRTRRLPKVWLHVALSVLVMNAAAVSVACGKGGDNFRRCVA